MRKFFLTIQSLSTLLLFSLNFVSYLRRYWFLYQTMPMWRACKTTLWCLSQNFTHRGKEKEKLLTLINLVVAELSLGTYGIWEFHSSFASSRFRILAHSKIIANKCFLNFDHLKLGGWYYLAHLGMLTSHASHLQE